MTIAEVIKLAYNAGFRDAALVKAVAIAIAESALNPNAEGDVTTVNNKWGPSIGLWQIRSLQPEYLYLEPVRNQQKLYDPVYNANAAYSISKNGTDFSLWSTYVYGNYKKNIDAVAAAAQAVFNQSVQVVKENKTGIAALLLIAATIYAVTR